ncbi:hypothetical protein B0H14DRAFT_3640233 [Mycena olivaceomarginata]|nr:hypothetical protein B0H14DRAFT_3640233 [Mycena olivaceomarginata]
MPRAASSARRCWGRSRLGIGAGDSLRVPYAPNAPPLFFGRPPMPLCKRLQASEDSVVLDPAPRGLRRDVPSYSAFRPGCKLPPFLRGASSATTSPRFFPHVLLFTWRTPAHKSLIRDICVLALLSFTPPHFHSARRPWLGPLPMLLSPFPPFRHVFPILHDIPLHAHSPLGSTRKYLPSSSALPSSLLSAFLRSSATSDFYLHLHYFTFPPPPSIRRYSHYLGRRLLTLRRRRPRNGHLFAQLAKILHGARRRVCVGVDIELYCGAVFAPSYAPRSDLNVGAVRTPHPTQGEEEEEEERGAEGARLRHPRDEEVVFAARCEGGWE